MKFKFDLSSRRGRLLQHRVRAVSVAVGAALSCAAWAGGEQTLERVVVTGSSTGLVGVADSANTGTVTQKQLEARTVYRPGELLEAAPGLIVSQHSGEGKANQFYLRGFNLDHGTDLRTRVDGMLVNQRSHAHGQGWTDLNFLIPELATRMEYRKGPYYASEGDFSSAGAVSIQYADSLPNGIASVGLGQNGFRRVLLADSPSLSVNRLHTIHSNFNTCVHNLSVCVEFRPPCPKPHRNSRRSKEGRWREERLIGGQLVLVA